MNHALTVTLGLVVHIGAVDCQVIHALTVAQKKRFCALTVAGSRINGSAPI
jgi:hypothetical protein